MTESRTTAIRAGLYIFLYLAAVMFLGPALNVLGGYLVGATGSILLAAWLANFLCLRIFEPMPFSYIGLRPVKASWRNLLLGLAGGMGTAAAVLGPALLMGAARVVPSAPDAQPSPGSIAFLAVALLVGSAGEEIGFHGYGFQILVRQFGPFTTIFPVGVFFASLHGSNPHSTWLALGNTAGFGILFGFAFWRSRDLWLPIGLHYGWNLALPLFGVNVSGFTMRLTAYSMEWSAGPLWSGGAYGPEGSLLTTAALILLGLYLWRAPIAEQAAPLLAGPPEA